MSFAIEQRPTSCSPARFDAGSTVALFARRRRLAGHRETGVGCDGALINRNTSRWESQPTGHGASRLQWRRHPGHRLRRLLERPGRSSSSATSDAQFMAPRSRRRYRRPRRSSSTGTATGFPTSSTSVSQASCFCGSASPVRRANTSRRRSSARASASPSSDIALVNTRNGPVLGRARARTTGDLALQSTPRAPAA